MSQNDLVLSHSVLLPWMKVNDCMSPNDLVLSHSALLPWMKRQADPRSHITIIDQRTTMTNHRRTPTLPPGTDIPLVPQPYGRPPSPLKPSSIPVALEAFVDYVTDGYKDSNMKFALQYEDLKMVGRDQSMEHALMVENRPKNR